MDSCRRPHLVGIECFDDNDDDDDDDNADDDDISIITRDFWVLRLRKFTNSQIGFLQNFKCISDKSEYLSHFTMLLTC